MKSANKPMEIQELLEEYIGLPEYVAFKSIDVNQVSLFGDRPINIAATRGIIKEIELLLENGADINNKGEHGYTPLHNAVEQEHYDAICLLLQKGGNRLIVNDSGQTPLDLAIVLDHTSLLEIFN